MNYKFCEIERRKMQKIVIAKRGDSFRLPLMAVIEFGKRKGFDLYYYCNTGYKFIEISSDNYNNCKFSKIKLKPKQKKDFDWLDIDDPDEIKRNDPDLIFVVEKYNPESLKIVEIPDNIEWYIVNDPYWGEFVCEKHKTWS
jgi:hypothetical protein